MGGVHRLSRCGLMKYFWTEVLISFIWARKPLDFGPDALTPCFCKGRHLHPQTTRRTLRPLSFFSVFFKATVRTWNLCMCITMPSGIQNAIQPRRLTHARTFYLRFVCYLTDVWHHMLRYSNMDFVIHIEVWMNERRCCKSRLAAVEKSCPTNLYFYGSDELWNWVELVI